MQKLLLLSLALTNFKGQVSFMIEPDGQNMTIYGDNATGKTTLADAWYWILFDKDSASRKDFEIKTVDKETGKVSRNLQHTVDLQLSVDGEQTTLRKTYSEKWVTTRGQADAEYTGNTTDHRVNGVPSPKAEYVRQVAAICDEKRFRLLSDPTYFNTAIAWQERRKVLLEVTGDVTDADVIASNPKLKDLPTILGRHTTDDYKKIATASRKECNQKREGIPARIDECNRNIGKTSANPETLATSLADLRAKLALVNEKEVRFASGGEIAETNKKIAELQTQVQQLRNQLAAQANAAGAEVHAAVNTAQAEVNRLEVALTRAKAEKQEALDAITRAEPKLAALRAEFAEVNAPQFEFTGMQECAACGQALPAEKVEAARQKAEEEFNVAKARKLEAIRAEGKSIGAGAETHREALVGIEQQITDLENQVTLASNQRDNLKAAAADIKPAETKDTPEILDLLFAIKKHETTVAELQTGTALHLAGVRTEKGELQTKISEAEATLAQVNEETKAKARIEELTKEQKDLAKQIESFDKELFLIEEFIRTKVSMLTDKINAKFSVARFRLFETQVNGGLAECCETTIDGVGYSDLNTGSKLNVGLDIIDALAEHYGFAPPIFIDNAESVTAIRPTHGQQIQLVVSAADKTLRVEAATTRQEALAI